MNYKFRGPKMQDARAFLFGWIAFKRCDPVVLAVWNKWLVGEIQCGASWVTPKYVSSWWLSPFENMRVHQVGSWNPTNRGENKKCWVATIWISWRECCGSIAQFQSHPIFCTPRTFWQKYAKVQTPCWRSVAVHVEVCGGRWKKSVLAEEFDVRQRLIDLFNTSAINGISLNPEISEPEM